MIWPRNSDRQFQHCSQDRSPGASLYTHLDGKADRVADAETALHGRPLVEMRRAWAADDDDVTQGRLGRVSDELMATSVSAARAARGGRAQESGVSVGGWHGWWVRHR
jgi:hypothetical protein